MFNIFKVKQDSSLSPVLYDIVMAKAQVPMPRLLAGEEVIYVKSFDERPPEHALTSLEAIERLARAKNFSEIGDFGPVLAARSLGPHGGEREFNRYTALFGRDSLRVAMDLVDRYPKLTRATLVRLAELQGVEENSWREEEPGRIIHEYRDPKVDPVARELTEQKGWGWPYYGSVDSTPEFIRTLMAYCRHEGYDFLGSKYTGRAGERTMADALEAAIGWICSRLDDNPDGLLEFKRANPNGIENQVWKDSWDSYFHVDGTMANHEKGVASVEIQRVAYDALMDAHLYYQKHGIKSKMALELKKRAEHLKKQLLKHFWSSEFGGYFMLGTDRGSSGNLRPLKVRTSNMGHLLHSRLFLDDDASTVHYREAIIKQLFSVELLSFSGIRTLSTDSIRFRPGSYHNGSVWIWDNYLIIQGLEMHEYYGLAHFLKRILIDDIDVVKRMPEYLRGDLDENHRLNNRLVEVQDNINQRVNRIEQPPQDIQAWTAAAILAIKSERKLPTEARDPIKRQFEQQVLAQIPFAKAFIN